MGLYGEFFCPKKGDYEMRRKAIWSTIILIVLLLSLCSCTSFHLTTVKYRVGGGFGRHDGVDNASWTDKYRRHDGRRWGINGGVELIYRRGRGKLQRSRPGDNE